MEDNAGDSALSVDTVDTLNSDCRRSYWAILTHVLENVKISARRKPIEYHRQLACFHPATKIVPIAANEMSLVCNNLTHFDFWGLVFFQTFFFYGTANLSSRLFTMLLHGINFSIARKLPNMAG